MENDKSLVKTENNIFSRIRQTILNFFHKFKKNKTQDRTLDTAFQEEYYQNSVVIKDFDILKDVVNGKISIKDLDIETEKRLIKLCDNRLKQINEKIWQKDLEIAKIEKILDDLS